ncbi:aminotransferase class I/II-fold pyridoxal phosphate-dependent enzyme [Butyrivibrio fibrisolvens]|uniref:aminotransferase class I/II-fold pyridoxal phosphate-dependent enzyme n=1 Tax=Pseudobutyrivibrio ruminis TaxID=46206 RepID=UPI00055C6035|nr:aminotransferase class I/II-fold pyridoxal phosphate-dependent enzyme [Pseudobutyrivibrio ruminis]MDC7279236.1 aminotransferase class I/II-fold pyridoxal phosphate-dependent enzyme [Butyrivibrio fibrisolvens]
MSLKKTLEKYSKSNMYPFHMPGHKRQLDGVSKIDMTEVEGVDDLHDASGVIAEDQKRMAKLFGADESRILVGGSTVGNLASVYASCNEGDSVIIQRNSHKSVYNAVMLRHLKCDYIEPDVSYNGIFKAVTLEQVKSAVEKGQAVPKAVIITSPTYEGFHAPVKEIAEYCHDKGIILIVDQAHGAHLGFNQEFKGSAVGLADITIQSLHKTLPSLTQTAAMHISGDRVDLNRVAEALDIFETSSPSYVLMNSISNCLDILENCGELFSEYVDNLQDFYSISGELKNLQLITDETDKKDPGKLIISTKNTNITGVELAKILREKYELETELSSFAYVLAMTSIMDTKEGFDRLKTALKEIDDALTAGHIDVTNLKLNYKKVMETFQAKAGGEKEVPLAHAEGKVSAAMVCLYPPGAPLIVPGEEISKEAIKVIHEAKAKGLHVTGMDVERESISVVN